MSTDKISNKLDLNFLASMETECDKFYKNLINTLVIDLLNYINQQNVEGLLLSGAATRGEATVMKTAEKYFSLSDIDLSLVPSEDANIQELKREITHWVVQKNKEWRTQVLGIDVSLKPIAAIKKLAPVIATYELKKIGYVVWGKKELLNLVPDYDVKQVEPQDCLRLLHNRSTEQLISRLFWNRSEEIFSQVEAVYRYGKLLLDLVTSFLFIENRSAITYKDRIVEFKKALAQPQYIWLKNALPGFLPELELWYSFKLSPDEDKVVKYYADSLGQKDLVKLIPELWKRGINYVRAFWIFEVNRVCNTVKLKTLIKDVAALYYKMETLPRKWMRWLKFVRHPYVDQHLFYLPRVMRLSFLAGPLLLSYLSSILTYLSHGKAEDSSELFSLAAKHFPLRLPHKWPVMNLDEKRLFFLKNLKYLHGIYVLGRRHSANE